jgi:hypothetical protein
MRTPIQGEALVDSLSREGLATLLDEASWGSDERAVDEYWKAFTTMAGRRAMLELIAPSTSTSAFLFDDEPGRCAQEAIDFLQQTGI